MELPTYEDNLLSDTEEGNCWGGISSCSLVAHNPFTRVWYFEHIFLVAKINAYNRLHDSNHLPDILGGSALQIVIFTFPLISYPSLLSVK